VTSYLSFFYGYGHQAERLRIARAAFEKNEISLIRLCRIETNRRDGRVFTQRIAIPFATDMTLEATRTENR